MGTKEDAHMTRIRSRRGSDIYKVHVPTGKVVQLTHQESTPNTGVVPEGTESHPRGVHNLGPVPGAGRQGRVLSAIATAIAESASRRKRRCNCSSWMTMAATSS